MLNDIEIMRSPTRWPIPGMLRLKRVRDGRLEPGTLILNTETGHTHFVAGTVPTFVVIFADRLIGAPTPTAESLFADGWRVD